MCPIPPPPLHQGLSIRQIITQMGDGEHYAMFSPKNAAKCIANVHLNKGMYYITGPVFSDVLHLPLKDLFDAAKAEGNDSPLAVKLKVNQMVDEAKAPPEAKIFMCGSLQDCLDTMQGLLVSY